MTRWLSIVLMLLAAGEVLASPQQAMAAALNDARSLPPGVREQTRYLPAYAIAAEHRAEFAKVLRFHCNSLSREAEFANPRWVTPDLAAVVLLDYGWDAATWERFAEADPYYHVQLIVKAQDQAWRYDRGRRGWFGSRHEKAVIVPGLAPWLPAKEYEELVKLTNSAVPMLRADWFVAQTAIAEGRKVGYYDLLGAGKKLADFEKIVGLDRAFSIKLKKEVQAVVQTSTVALHNRHIVRYQSITGAYWETFDAKENTDQRNAIRLLNGDFTHDARETYGTLPNGLFAFFLSDAVGNRANTAPDFIASDGRSGGTDRRVHVGLSCVRCHVPGIQPIDDWARKLYRGDIKLDVTDLNKYVRLRQLYTSDLDGRIAKDQADYAETLKRCNGLTPAENARAYAAAWGRYNEALLSVEDVARETGYTPQAIVAAIKGRAQAGLADPVLVGLLQRPSIPIVRSHFEELQPLLYQTLGAHKP